MRWILVLVLASGCEPGPGEVRCSTSNVYGTNFTRCKAGPPIQQPAPPARPTFWCTSRVDGGACLPAPGQCEAWRHEQNARCTGAPGGCALFGECYQAPTAICAPSGCFTTPATCATAERNAGRDGSACVSR